MANTAQARKRAKQSEKRRIHNVEQRSAFRTSIKKVLSAIESGNKEDAQTTYTACVPVIDWAAGKGHIHPNKAARHKSRLNTAVRAM